MKSLWRKIIIIMLILTLLTACQSSNQEETDGVLTEADLKGCNLSINNITCSDIHEVRKVDDVDLIDDIISLLTPTIPFRPILLSDIKPGKADATLFFETEGIQYTIGFGNAEEQLSLDYIHREKPVISVSKREFDDYGLPHTVWKWYCTMSAADYATAFEMVASYSKGEIETR